MAYNGYPSQQQPRQKPQYQMNQPQGWSPSNFQPGNGPESPPSVEPPSGGDANPPVGLDGQPIVTPPTPPVPQMRNGGKTGGYLTSLANSLAGQVYNAAPINTGSEKAGAVDFLSQQKQNQTDLARQQAAQRGASLSGPRQGAIENQIENNYTSNLANAYRGIDENANQTGYQRLLSGLSGVSGLQGQQFNQGLQNSQFDLSKILGLGNLGVAQGQLGINQANATSAQDQQFLNLLLALLGGA